eukprot:scaffold292883_cov16-Prasinocladus_malaysianus.AAC.2
MQDNDYYALNARSNSLEVRFIRLDCLYFFCPGPAIPQFQKRGIPPCARRAILASGKQGSTPAWPGQ